MVKMMIELLFECVEMVMNNSDSVEEILDDVVVNYIGLVEVYCYWLIVVVDNY